ncbi:MAG: anthranilate synthase component I family protein [Bacteroidales bacterium]|nr:anthranilate synthase component I family protein [Bacteroidales bacterium]
MKKHKIKLITKRVLADVVTPVSIYIRARESFPKSFLLESSDYHGHENSYSFICLDPVATFMVDSGSYYEEWPDGTNDKGKLENIHDFRDRFDSFIRSFEVAEGDSSLVNGIFGYSSYDAVQYFETIKFHSPVKEEYNIPDLQYNFFRHIIAINHFNNDLTLLENLFDGQKSEIEKIQELIFKIGVIEPDKFIPSEKEKSNITDEEYMQMVTYGKKHCQRGDVFQIVLSRQFSQPYSGDDFNLYRALRSVNPSPYLFYFDYGDFCIFGSSPEAQLKIENGRAVINPIAGTFKRTGDDVKDNELAIQLCADPKENAEHVMLVDLARNDLSRHGTDVHVDKYREVQFYSHVIHLVSTVSGQLNEPSKVVDMMMATFPAGTLSGAPKYKAMELIDKYENQNRSYYGGAIGFIDLQYNLNHAIMIRTFLSKNNTLFYQAGAGIVSESKEENELQEVNNKLGALKKAINLAKEI